MKKAIQFHDVLGNIIQIKTVIDTFRQVKNEPCWTVESRKIFPQNTNWDYYSPLKNQYFNSDEEVQEIIKNHLLKYIEKSKKLGKNSYFEEILL